MYRCKLYNSYKTALSIFSGSDKTVCAWIACQELEICKNQEISDKSEIFYSPRISPFWRDSDDVNIDNEEYDFLKTYNKSIFISDTL